MLSIGSNNKAKSSFVPFMFEFFSFWYGYSLQINIEILSMLTQLVSNYDLVMLGECFYILSIWF